MASGNHIQSVLKAAELLKIIGDSEDGIKLSQIAEIMNQKLPAIHHLSQTLISCGFVRKRPDNILTLGDELIRMASKARDDLLLDHAAAEMTRVFNLFPRSVVILAQTYAERVELVLRISYERPNVIQKQQGQIFNIYVNAVALVSMAMMDEDHRELMLHKQPFSEYGILLWKDYEKFIRYLEQVKSEGFAISPFDQQTSFRIAVPIISGEGELKGALGISIPNSRTGDDEKENMRRELLKSATAIGENL